MIDIIIVNWNSGGLLRDCLKSISDFGVANVASVIIVDNGSTDDSLSGIDQCGLPIKIVCNEENIGFASACNQGAAYARSDYLLFLNPDTRLFENSLSIPFQFMESLENKDVAVCGIQLINELGNVARSCARFPTLTMFILQAFGVSRHAWFKSLNTHMAEWDHGSTASVDHVIGAFYFIRRSVFDSVNGFDERFFVYLEDLDLSLRLRQKGYLTYYLADVGAFHAEGGSSRQVKAHRLFYSLRSRLLYGFKHFSTSRAFILLGITVLVEPMSRLVFSFIKGGMSDVRNTLDAYLMLLVELPQILRTNRRLAKTRATMEDQK